jgi:hypothetical protein
MGLEYTLYFHCKILPEYVDFIQKEYLKLYDNYKLEDLEEEEEYDVQEDDKYKREQQRERQEKVKKEYNALPKSYRDLIDICNNLRIPGYISMYSFDPTTNNFLCSSYKNQHYYDGDLRSAYRSFLQDVIVPISSEISSCEIRCEDFYKMTDVYTDTELRGVPFNLQSKIKRIEHIYDENESEIIETRVIYKHSIKRLQRIDLDRAYGQKS